MRYRYYYILWRYQRYRKQLPWWRVVAGSISLVLLRYLSLSAVASRTKNL